MRTHTTTMPMMRQTTGRITATAGGRGQGQRQVKCACDCSALKQVYQRVKIAEHNMQNNNNNNNTENNSSNNNNKQAERRRAWQSNVERAAYSNANHVINMQSTHTHTHKNTPNPKP